MPPLVITAANTAISITPNDLIVRAMKKLNIIAPGETPSAAEISDGLEELQALIDSFNARRALIYNVNFVTYTLTANHTPHTIGPTGDFNVPVRPVQIVNAALVLTSVSTPIDLPMVQMDDEAWAAVRIKGLTSTLPTKYYYSPDTPLGKIYFWPVPTEVNDVRLETWTGLAQAIDLVTPIGFPAGYWDAVVLSLAMRLAPGFGATPSGVLLQAWQLAMKGIEGNNAGSPRLATQSAGMPGGNSAVIPGFNFLTGEPW